MKRINYSGIAAVGVVVSLFVMGCSSPAPKVAETPVQVVVEPDMAAVKAEIQALENSWAAADNSRDANAIAAFYAEDAVSLSNNKPMSVGRAAIQAEIEAGLAKRVAGSTVSYDVLDVFGDDKQVTEVGKSTFSDASGKVISTGKYMAVWEKRDGKYICIRDIYNEDVKEK